MMDELKIDYKKAANLAAFLVSNQIVQASVV